MTILIEEEVKCIKCEDEIPPKKIGNNPRY